MLVLTRKRGQEIVIDGRISIRVKAIRHDVVDVELVHGPPGTQMVRGEVALAERLAQIKAGNSNVLCPRCQSRTDATVDGAMIRYVCSCGWAITQSAIGDAEELALERWRSLRLPGPREEMRDPLER